MPARNSRCNPSRRSAAAAVGAIERHWGPDDPRLPELRRDLRAAQLEDHVRRIIEQAPEITSAQRVRITALLWGVTDVPA